MRLLFTCVPAYGRFFTIAALARAAARSGHEVLVATNSSIHALVTGAGLKSVAMGSSIDDLRRGVVGSQPSTAQPEDQIASQLFTKFWPASALPELLTVAHGWQSDVIVHEEGELTAPLAGALLGITNIAVSWTGPKRFARQWRSLDEAVAPLWRAHGLPAPSCGGMLRTLFLDQCPASLQLQAFPWAAPSTPLRPEIYDGAGTWAPPPWIGRIKHERVVFATLGTVAAFNRAPHIVSAITTALSAQSLELIVSIGPDNVPSARNDLPDNVHIEPFVPQSLLNPQLTLVLCHGGPGTAMSALSHGVPLLLMPRGGAVQLRMAAACERAGAARTLSQGEVSAKTIRSNVQEMIENPRYRLAAQRIAAEIADMPGSDVTLASIERIVETRRRAPPPASVMRHAR